MFQLENHKDQCPYCGEIIELLIDCSLAEQDYIEDCQVCCRPISVQVRGDYQGQLTVHVAHENE
ncbi:CPXCG motif-containing cysteine-rich protein [Psychromonas sp.]|uniref:CPXCG motif-containing cysteine-rich protein n=1 Tax=Psychromonas sp. TaxID=1884585 RepID=UPI003566A709